jgi:hypothetical protein
MLFKSWVLFIDIFYVFNGDILEAIFDLFSMIYLILVKSLAVAGVIPLWNWLKNYVGIS